MRYGNRTEAADFGDPDAMLARFEPGPERVARLVLHPRLSFVPCAAEDFDAFQATFAVDVPARILSADDVIAARTSGIGTADITNELDTAIEAVLSRASSRTRRVVASPRPTRACKRRKRGSTASPISAPRWPRP